jgi:5-methyltetrahydrofolate--homocysteine methyltransferase
MINKEDWDETKDAFEDWWEGSLDRPILQIFAPKGDYWRESIDSWVFLRYYPHVNKAIDILLSQFKETCFLGEAYPNAWINLGPGILSACLGADIKFNPKINTAWFEGRMSLEDVRKAEFNAQNEWWKYIVECTQRALEICHRKAIVGLTDVQDPITILGQLRGNFPTNLIRDIFLDWNNLIKALERIQEIWFQFYEMNCKLIDNPENGFSTWADLWSNKKYCMLQCDISVYFSPKIFDKLVYPYIVEACKSIERTIWHLDGPLEIKHLEKLLNIPELNGIQWVPGAGNPDGGDDAWLPLYRRIQERGKLLQIFVPPQKVTHILSKISPKGVAIQTACASYKEAQNLINKFRSIYG